MKKVTKNKLQLDKQTIAVLSSSQLIDVAGGQKPETNNTQCADFTCGTLRC
jgi:hypothetical protein